MGRQHIARLARNDVEVDVKHALARGRAIELRQHDAIRVQRLVHGARDLLGGGHHRRHAVLRQVQHVLGGLFRHNQRVAFRLGHHVHEGQRLVVFIDLHARNLATQDLREDVAVVIGHGAPW